MAGVDKKLSEFADSLAEASILIEDAAADLRRYRDSVDFDPEELARQQDRFAQLKGLLRQYGPTMDDVFARLESSKELLSLVDDAGER